MLWLSGVRPGERNLGCGPVRARDCGGRAGGRGRREGGKLIRARFQSFFVLLFLFLNVGREATTLSGAGDVEAGGTFLSGRVSRRRPRRSLPRAGAGRRRFGPSGETRCRCPRARSPAAAAPVGAGRRACARRRPPGAGWRGSRAPAAFLARGGGRAFGREAEPRRRPPTARLVPAR